MKYEIAKTQSEFFQLMKVRTDVFIIEQNVSPVEELDSYDYDAVHFIALDEDHVVGTCRIMLQGMQAKLGRMAVLQSHRNQHIGHGLIACVEAHRSQLGFTSLKLAAQITAIPFYEKAGFTAFGDEFLDANIKHRMMVKDYE